MSTSDIITDFYFAFKNGDAAAMASFYHDDAEFQDPAFGKLKGSEVTMMWKMLIEKSEGNLDIEFTIVEVTENSAVVAWEAKYPFSKTKRTIHNKITAHISLKDGKIATHHDHFNLWKWSRQALGIKGLLIGWTPFFISGLQKTTRRMLKGYMRKKS